MRGVQWVGALAALPEALSLDLELYVRGLQLQRNRTPLVSVDTCSHTRWCVHTQVKVEKQ